MARGKLVKPLNQEVIDKFAENNRKQNRSRHPWNRQSGSLKRERSTIQCYSCGVWKLPDAFPSSGQPCLACRTALSERVY